MTADDKNPSDDEFPPYFIDLYKLGAELADRVSARRGTTNSFFLTLNSGLAALFAVGYPASLSSPNSDRATLLFVTIFGMTLAVTWWVLIRSYRDLNRAKFDVLLSMEKRLELSLFGDEWTYLQGDPVRPFRKRYAEFSFIERVVPVVFFIGYLALGLRAIV